VPLLHIVSRPFSPDLPRFTRVTWLLWLGPFLLLVVALIVGARVVRNRRKAAAAELPAPASEAAARDLLS